MPQPRIDLGELERYYREMLREHIPSYLRLYQLRGSDKNIIRRSVYKLCGSNETIDDVIDSVSGDPPWGPYWSDWADYPGDRKELVEFLEKCKRKRTNSRKGVKTKWLSRQLIRQPKKS